MCIEPTVRDVWTNIHTDIKLSIQIFPQSLTPTKGEFFVYEDVVCSRLDRALGKNNADEESSEGEQTFKIIRDKNKCT